MNRRPDDATFGLVLVAAGRSERMGGVDKAFALLAGRPLLAHSLATFEATGLVRRHVLVVAAERLQDAHTAIRDLCLTGEVAIVPGGARRRDSVVAGLQALPGEEWVMIHDAARPLVSAGVIRRAAAAAQECGAAAPAVCPVDTVKEADEEGRILRTLDRRRIRLLQTPQAFRKDLILRAHLANKDDDVPDDTTLVERLGFEVRIVEGDPRNFKVTYPDDLLRAAALLKDSDR